MSIQMLLGSLVPVGPGSCLLGKHAPVGPDLHLAECQTESSSEELVEERSWGATEFNAGGSRRWSERGTGK
jgi:hypothetical protein